MIGTKKNLVQASSGSTGSLSSYDYNTYNPLTSKLATRWVYTICYTHDESTRYFEINSISFHLIFLRKVDGCWSLVSMRYIIHRFVNVYPYITYSCEVAIHISWILGSGPRWYGKWHSHVIQEQGNNYSGVDIIAFLFEVFKYLFRQIFLKSIYFSSCKIPKN